MAGLQGDLADTRAGDNLFCGTKHDSGAELYLEPRSVL